ncbi:uncharacterized protein [Dysidea avara]
MAIPTGITSSLVPLKGVKHFPKDEVGRGAYGVVYRAQYNGKDCAAKKIHAVLLNQVGAPEQNHVCNAFLQECAHCSSLHHPNIVEFWGICYQAKDPVLIMEMMDESLTNFIETKAPKPGVPFSTKICILLDIAKGLSYLHSQQPPVVHRDLSPNNILLKTNRGAVSVVKIADLGVAKVIKVHREETRSKLTQAPGTAAFMPPEATQSDPIYGVSLDVFSFGGVTLFLATHEWPKPTDITSTDPKTGKLIAFTEVERRQKYLDQMTAEMKKLKPLTLSCLDNDLSKRPRIEEVLKILKKEAVLEYYELDDLHDELHDDNEMSNSNKIPAENGGKKQPSTEKCSLPHLWYVGCLSRTKAESMVKHLYDGVFLVREVSQKKGCYSICLRLKRTPYHVPISFDPMTRHFYLSKEKMFSTIYELVGHYQNHSLISAIPEVNTTLKHSYYEIASPPRSKIAFPWPISPETPPPDVEAIGESPIKIHKGSKKSSKWFDFKRSSKQEIRASNEVGSSYPKVDHPAPVPEASAIQNNHCLEPCDEYVENEFYAADNDDGKHGVVKEVIEPPIQMKPWYFGDISRDSAVMLLARDGDYLVRYSNRAKGYVLTFQW